MEKVRRIGWGANCIYNVKGKGVSHSSHNLMLLKASFFFEEGEVGEKVSGYRIRKASKSIPCLGLSFS